MAGRGIPPPGSSLVRPSRRSLLPPSKTSAAAAEGVRGGVDAGDKASSSSAATGSTSSASASTSAPLEAVVIQMTAATSAISTPCSVRKQGRKSIGGAEGIRSVASATQRRPIFPHRPMSSPTPPKRGTGVASRLDFGGDDDDDAAAGGVRSARVRVCVRIRPLLDSDFGPPNGDPPASAKKSRNGGRRERPPFDAGDGSGSQVGRQRHPSSTSKPPPPTDPQARIPAFATSPSDPHTVSQSPHTNPDPDKTTSYTFDRVYSALDATATLYEESIHGVVRSVVEGYHGSVFAYGQTNSGKTHTMTGTPREPGVVRLAVRAIFDLVRQGKHSGGTTREYLLRVSYLEIYNEQIYDLLAAPPPVENASSHSSSALQHHQLPPATSVRIFESKTEGVIVRGLKEEIVTRPEDVYALLDAGDARRKVGSTGMNRSSSRSHSVFRFVIESREAGPSAAANGGANPSSNSSVTSDTGDSVATGRSSITPSLGAAVKGPVRISSLSLVDLAGSECAKLTGSSGMRQKEGNYINKSLLTLGHVVHKLSETSARRDRGDGPIREQHIPYRDSKLTRLLQPSLGGNAQVALVCNISPVDVHKEESHNTLKFATRAKRIQQHARITEVKDDKTLLRSYREEIEELKRQLKVAAQEARTSSEGKKRSSATARGAGTDLGDGFLTELSDEEGDKDDEDQDVLVSAIQNLECLILKAGAGAKMTKSGSGNGIAANLNQQPRRLGEEADGGVADDPTRVLYGALREAAAGDAIEQARDPSSSNAMEDRDPRNTKLAVEDEDDVNNILLEDLHRIQGMLGSLMKGQNPLGPKTPGKSSAYAYQTPKRDAEVERLRLQLQEQEVASTMRKADSSFLQGQLSERDGVLDEVSVLLEALSKRQVKLENENKRLHEDLEAAAVLIEEGERERDNLRQILAEKNQ